MFGKTTMAAYRKTNIMNMLLFSSSHFKTERHRKEKRALFPVPINPNYLFVFCGAVYFF